MLDFIKLTLVFILFGFNAFSQYGKSLVNNMRSDTIDVLDYKIDIDFTDIASENMIASARVKFEAKMNDIESISLDLLEFTIDSVKQGNNHINFTYDDTLLVAEFTAPLDEEDVDSVTIFYQGTPQTDPSGLGGFYFMGGGAFNFGVGLTADPHNYGRVWHPCFDNFVERASYDITFKTPGSLFAYSAGDIESESVDGAGNNVRRWVIDNPIQTYLMGFAIYDYTHVSDSYESISGDQIPIMLAAKPGDTTNVKNSFINLKNALEAYEEAFGPYVWDKVGYFFVPFSSAAMEHATGIIYPQAIANGGLNFETIMAHELSHHWFGNLVTCETASDMWINEAFATFCEPLFLEKIYDYEDYLDELKDFHLTAIQRAHFDDGDFYPLSGIPNTATYGTHTYRKGATVVHNLRTYLGDVLFFDGLTELLDENAFTSMDAEKFKDELAIATGQNLDDFFNGWIMNKGYPGFNIDSFNVENVGGNYDVSVFVKQRLHQAPDYFNGVPMKVTFVDENWNKHHETMTVSGETSQASFSLPFNPVMVYLNDDEGIFNATTGENFTINTSAGNINDYVYSTIVPSNVSDSSFLRVEHHRTAPDNFENSALDHQFEISPDRFWRIDGIFEEEVKFSCHFAFDSRDNASGNLDSGLVNNIQIGFHEDSIVLLWREGAGSEWKEHEDYDLSTQGSPTDGRARIIANDVKKGEYTFAIRVNIANVEEYSLFDENKIILFPNPAEKEVQITMPTYDEVDVTLFNAQGNKIMTERNFKSGQKIDIENLSNGNYFILLSKDGHKLGEKKLIVR